VEQAFMLLNVSGGDSMVDSQGQEDFLNPYIFALNNSINSIDILGLKWTIKRDSNQNRALVIGENGDTVADLAKIIHLDPDDYKKWLQLYWGFGYMPNSPSDPIKSLCSEWYSIPNTVYIGRGFLATSYSESWEYWMSMPSDYILMSAQAAGFKNFGAKVVRINRMKFDDMKDALASADTYAVSYFGHGPDWGFWTSSYASDTWDSMPHGDARRYLHHGLAFVLDQACYGERSGYDTLVSKNGKFGYIEGQVAPALYFSRMKFESGTYSK
jgi:hypothetical protein